MEREAGAPEFASGAPVYFFDLVEDRPEIGGVATVSRRLRRALAARLGRRLVPVREIAASLGCGDRGESYLTRERRAIERLAEREPASTFLIPNFQNPIARSRLRPRIVNIVHDVQFAHLPALFTDEQQAWLRAAFAETRAHADAIAFVSRASREDFTARFGTPTKSVVIPAPLGATSDGGCTAPRHAAPYLIAVQHGHCHPHKNVDALLGLFAGLSERFPDLALVVAGGGDGTFREACARLPAAIQTRIEHRGRVPRNELTSLYRGAEAFVSLSRFEGFNMPAAEAASCGTPLILSDLPVHRELHGATACFVAPSSPDLDHAARFLAERAAHRRGSAWPLAASCSAEAVAASYACLIADLEADAVPVARRVAATARTRRIGTGVRRPSLHPAALSPARAVIRRQRLACALLAGTVLGGSAALGGGPPWISQALAFSGPGCSSTAASGGGGGAAQEGTAVGTGGCNTSTSGSNTMPAGLASASDGSGYYGGGGGAGASESSSAGAGGGSGGALGGAAGTTPSNGGSPGGSVDGDAFGAGGGGGGGFGGMLAGSGSGFTGGNGGSGGSAYYSGGGTSGGGGGGGGGGGAGTIVTSSGLALDSGSSLGGIGGAGGSAFSGAGGGGGEGGIGTIVATDLFTVGSETSSTGGAGGNGGASSNGTPGSGGAGGAGLVVVGGGTITNLGTIMGGVGGMVGTTGGSTEAAARLDAAAPGYGLGGVGVIGANIAIVTSGAISGGLSGDGAAQANAITFTGGANTLTLQNGFSFGGNIAVTGSVTFAQNDPSFTAEVTNTDNATQSVTHLLGTTAITGSGSVIKTGAGTLILSGANTYSGGTTIQGGVLQIAALSGTPTSTSLGSGSVLLDGGTLQAAQQSNGHDGLTLGNAIEVGAAGGTVDLNNNGLTLTGTIGNGAPVPGLLTFADSTSGGQVITLSGRNTFTGGVAITSGAFVESGTTNALGTGSLQVGPGGAFFLGGYDQSVTRLGGTGGILNIGAFTAPTTNTLTVESGSFGGLVEDGTSSSGERGVLALTKVSDGSTSGGTLILSGQSYYTGATTVNAGTLQAGSTTGLADYSAFRVASGAVLDLGGFSNSVRALSGTGLVTNSGSGPASLSVGLVNDTSSQFDGTLADGVSALGLTKVGAGTLTLTGTNTYTGGTTIGGGTLQIGGGGTAGSIVGDVTDNATLAFDRSDTLTYGGTISGTGGLNQIGPGTLTLTGANTYTGATAVRAGRLAVDGSLGTTAVTVSDGATLGGSGTISGAVTIADGGILAPGNSPGTITVGSLTLTPGANGSTGSVLNYELGAIAPGNGPTSDLTNVTGNLTLAGTLNATDAGGFTYGSYRIFNYGGALTNDGLAIGALPTGYTGVVQTVIPNQINLVVASPTTPLQFWDGALLAGNGTIAGGTGVWTNSLTNWTDPNGANNAAFGHGVGIFAGAAGTVTVADTIAFQGLQFTTDGYTIAAAAGGTLVPTGQAFVRVGSGLTATIGAPFTGTGGLVKLSNGTLILTGTNTFTGGTTVSEGTLQIGNGGTTGSIAGNITDNAALVFDRADAATSGGVISGSGTVTQAGAGTLTLTGANTYTGLTTISAGTTLALAGAGSIAASTLFDAGTFDISQTGGASLTSLSGTGAVDLGARTLTLTAASGTFGGAIGGGGGVVLQAGTEVLTGTNTYGGGTSIVGGTLQIGNGGTTGSIVGTVVDDGALVFDRSDAVTFNGVISGGGAVAKVGAGTLSLTGASTYSGGTALEVGTLAIGSATAIGTGPLSLADGTVLQATKNGLKLANASVLFGTATFDTQAFDFAFAGPISGTGTLAKTGSGTLTLSGIDSYGGGTLLRQGTIALGRARALGTGRLTMDAGTVLSFTDDLTLANAIRFSGVADPTIDTGVDTDTISGRIDGAGALTKVGTGALILTGTDPYTGATTVAAGTLEVDGSTASSATTVASGATLSGTGTVGSIAARSGATVSPGTAASPYGVLHTPGSAAFFAGSTYQVTISPTGQTSSLAVGGTATLGGAAVTVASAAGTYNAATRYAILTATGGVNGQFGTLSTASALAFLSPYLSYTANAVTLAFQTNGTSFGDIALTPNERSVAAALQSLDPNSTLIRSLQGLSPDQARLALDALAGAPYASVVATAAQDARRVATQILDRLWNIGGGEIDARTLLQQLAPPGELPAFVNCYAPAPPPVQRTLPSVVTAWGEGFGDFGHDGADRNGAGIDHSVGGFIIGYDAPLHGLGAPYRIGIAGGYTDTSFSGTGPGGSGGNGSFESVFGALYGGARYGAIDVRAGVTVAGTSTTVDRSVAYPGFSEGEHSVYGGNTEQIFGEVGYRFSGTRWVVEPIVNAAYTHVHQDAFQERGGAAALLGFAQDDDVGTTTLGARGEYAPFVGIPLVGRAFLGWRHGFGDLDPATRLAFEAGSIPFTSQGAAIDRDALSSEIGVDWRTSTSMTLGLAYIGQVGQRDSDNGVKGRFDYKF